MYPSFLGKSAVYVCYFLLIFADRLVCLFNLKLNIMETTINTFCKFKEYKEKRVRELIRKYNVFLGMPWGLIIVICGICCLLLLNIPNFASKNSYLKVALILSSAFAILAIVKYIRSLQIQKVVYDCLNCFSNSVTRLNPKIGNPLCIDLPKVNEANMYTYTNPRTGIQYIYDTENKIAFSHYTDDLDGDWILDDYGIRSWVESLPTKSISMATLANSYRIIGL